MGGEVGWGDVPRVRSESLFEEGSLSEDSNLLARSDASESDADALKSTFESLPAAAPSERSGPSLESLSLSTASLASRASLSALPGASESEEGWSESEPSAPSLGSLSEESSLSESSHAPGHISKPAPLRPCTPPARGGEKGHPPEHTKCRHVENRSQT